LSSFKWGPNPELGPDIERQSPGATIPPWGNAIYFTFVTSLTIGYGDIVPRQALGRALAVGIGFCGLFLTGLTAGIAMYALRTALAEREKG